MAVNCRTWIVAVTCLLSAPAMADDSEGPYVFISAGQSVSTNACQSAWIPALASWGSNSACSEKSPVVRGGVGYQYTPMWGLEVNYGQFGYASSDGFANFPPPFISGPAYYSWQLKATGLAVQATATLHMGDTISLLGKFGLARVEFVEYMYKWNSKLPPGYSSYYSTPVVNTVRNVPALAGGIQFDLGPHGTVRLLVESFGSSDIYSSTYGPTPKVRLTAASLGLVYRY